MPSSEDQRPAKPAGNVVTVWTLLLPTGISVFVAHAVYVLHSADASYLELSIEVFSATVCSTRSFTPIVEALSSTCAGMPTILRGDNLPSIHHDHVGHEHRTELADPEAASTVLRCFLGMEHASHRLRRVHLAVPLLVATLRPRMLPDLHECHPRLPDLCHAGTLASIGWPFVFTLSPMSRARRFRHRRAWAPR